MVLCIVCAMGRLTGGVDLGGQVTGWAFDRGEQVSGRHLTGGRCSGPVGRVSDS